MFHILVTLTRRGRIQSFLHFSVVLRTEGTKDPVNFLHRIFVILTRRGRIQSFLVSQYKTPWILPPLASG